MQLWPNAMRQFSANIAGFLLVSTLFCSGQQSIQRKVDHHIETEMRIQRIPGLSLAVLTNGQLAFLKGYGLANIEHRVPVKPETIFQSGSVGKQFTAAAILLLVQDGRLSLEDELAKYFSGAPRSWSNVTVHHLLTHTAGFTDYPEDFDLQRDYTEDELLKRIMTIPLQFRPGEKWAYSNLGYVTLGILINKTTGRFYGDFLQERIFRPLRMDTARIISEANIVSNRAAGYVLVKGELKNQPWVAPMVNTTADGALYLTVLDMAKWEVALCSEKILSKASLAQMWTPGKLSDGRTCDYGYGWFVKNSHGRRIIEHGGSWQGFKAHIARYPDQELTVVIFANLAQAKTVEMAHAVAAICNPKLASR